MSKLINIGIIGLGQRGPGLMSQLARMTEKVKITAVCDLFPDRVQAARKKLKENYNIEHEVFGTTNAYELIDRDDVDAIIIASSWESHIPLSIYAMNAGVAVGCEVAGAYSVEQCWDLVKTYEKTKTPIMLLENACYEDRLMAIRRMVKAGFFGEIVHCDCSYSHDIRDEIADGVKIRHYRLRNYLNRNGDNYPMHGLGPVAQYLNINHGNRFISIASFASQAYGLEEFIKTERADVPESQGYRFKQGDIITSIIQCANGETIRLHLSTTTPRPYCEDINIYGTKSTYRWDVHSFFDGRKDERDGKNNWSKNKGNGDKFVEEWRHPVWKEFKEQQNKVGGGKFGHGGIDWLTLCDFVDSLRENKPMPIGVYDMASWMVVTTLSERSIANGGEVVEFPDFTNGRWLYDKAF